MEQPSRRGRVAGVPGGAGGGGEASCGVRRLRRQLGRPPHGPHRGRTGAAQQVPLRGPFQQRRDVLVDRVRGGRQMPGPFLDRVVGQPPGERPVHRLTVRVWGSVVDGCTEQGMSELEPGPRGREESGVPSLLPRGAVHAEAGADLLDQIAVAAILGGGQQEQRPGRGLERLGPGAERPAKPWADRYLGDERQLVADPGPEGGQFVQGQRIAARRADRTAEPALLDARHDEGHEPSGVVVGQARELHRR
ncbi:hypothetical protein WHI96_24370 [Pseudonocardia tropica]|uniref:Uncharacterized protein n=1 Tax=Pseudonocardia tropica TaxID=681289 RepID=A0ABV1K3N2_9PSEU